MISPNLLMFVLNIPKNASSFIQAWTEQFGWKANLYHTQEHRITEAIIILRDPIDRWISGITQYLQSYILHAKGTYDLDQGPGAQDQYMSATDFVDRYNDVVHRLIYDNLDRFDDHVWPQNELVQGILENKRRVYYYLDPTLEDRLSQHFGIPKVSNLSRNAGSDSTDGRLLQEFFKEMLHLRPDLRKRVMQRYQQDYELIDRVFDGHHKR